MTYAHLLDLADDGSLVRGREYAAKGRVSVRSIGPGTASAVATGSREYDLTLDANGGTCTCPMGMRDVFCKHLVALALVLDGRVDADEAGPAPEDDDDRPVTSTDAWLANLDADALRRVLHALAEDPDVADALDRLAASATGDVSVLEPLVDSLRVSGHLDYYEAIRHGQQAHQVVDALEETLSRATADAALPLLEKGIAHLTRALLRSDDSSGVQGHATQRLLDLHQQAASLGRPDPVRLAKWMAKVGFAEDGFFEIDPVGYAVPLGERGLATYRREVDRRLAAKPDDFHPRRARERLAVLAGDVPAIVELVGGPLDRPYHFARLVDALLEIGADDEALEYACRGVTAAPVAHQTIPLYDIAVRLLRDRDDTAEVLRLRRQQLRTFPIEQSYAALSQAAEDAGIWAGERLSALDVLLERNPPAWLRTLLAEGETELAWEASRDMELDPALALTLLRARAGSHPGDVVDPYAALIEHTLGPTDKQAYRQGVTLLGELRRAAVAAGRADDYETFVAGLLQTHRRRPTLVDMLRRMPPP